MGLVRLFFGSGMLRVLIRMQKGINWEVNYKSGRGG